MASDHAKALYLQRLKASASPHSLHSQAWQGDRMLHIYLWDYFRKRGFTKAAQALVAEAGVPSDQDVPIDAPQGLIFEWWTVFWEIFTARSTKAHSSLLSSSDAHAYLHNQQYRQFYPIQAQYNHHRQNLLFSEAEPSSNRQSPSRPDTTLPLATQLQPISPISQTDAPQQSRNGDWHQQQNSAQQQQYYGQASAGFAASPVVVESRQHNPSYPQYAELDQFTCSTNEPGPPIQILLKNAQPMIKSGQEPDKGPMASIPQAINQNLSRILNLSRPANTLVIQQCMNMLNLASKSVEDLTHDERLALSNRIQRFQTTQDDAQTRFAQHHGLHAPVATGDTAQPRAHRAAPSPPVHAGQKRKESPNLHLPSERSPPSIPRSEAEQQVGIPLILPLSIQAQMGQQQQSSMPPSTPDSANYSLQQLHPVQQSLMTPTESSDTQLGRRQLSHQLFPPPAAVANSSRHHSAQQSHSSAPAGVDLLTHSSLFNGLVDAGQKFLGNEADGHTALNKAVMGPPPSPSPGPRTSPLLSKDWNKYAAAPSPSFSPYTHQHQMTQLPQVAQLPPNNLATSLANGAQNSQPAPMPINLGLVTLLQPQHHPQQSSTHQHESHLQPCLQSQPPAQTYPLRSEQPYPHHSQQQQQQQQQQEQQPQQQQEQPQQQHFQEYPHREQQQYEHQRPHHLQLQFQQKLERHQQHWQNHLPPQPQQRPSLSEIQAPSRPKSGHGHSVLKEGQNVIPAFSTANAYNLSDGLGGQLPFKEASDPMIRSATGGGSGVGLGTLNFDLNTFLTGIASRDSRDSMALADQLGGAAQP